MRDVIDVCALAPVIKAAVLTALQQWQAEQRRLERDVLTEAEAADFLRLNVRQLRRERNKGRIQASFVAGTKARYLASDLMEYLMRNRISVGKAVSNGPVSGSPTSAAAQKDQDA